MTFSASITDVELFGIYDGTGKCYYSLNFNEVDEKDLFLNIKQDSILLYKEKPLFVSVKVSKTGEKIFIVLLSKESSNEFFIKNAFDNLVQALETKLGRWSYEKIEVNYDYIMLLANEFVYNGIILDDSYDSLIDKIPKRPFESVKGIKVNKGFASILNKAAKNLKNSFSK